MILTDQEFETEVITKTEGILPKQLNVDGCRALCQSLFVSAIYDDNKEFFSYQLGELVCELANIKNNYNLKKIITNYNPETIRQDLNIKYDYAKLIEDAPNYTLSELATLYGTTDKNIRIALSKNHIAWKGKKIYANSKTTPKVFKKPCRWVQLEFAF